MTQAKLSYMLRLDAVWQADRGTRNSVLGVLLPQFPTILTGTQGAVLPPSNRAFWVSGAGVLFSWEPFDFVYRHAKIRSAQSTAKRTQSQIALTWLGVATAVIETTEQIVLKTLDEIKRLAGPENVAITLGYVGACAPSYPINLIYSWTSGPHQAVLLVQLKKNAHVRVSPLEEQLRAALGKEFPGTDFTLESGEIVSQIMDFGSPTPIEVAIHGPSTPENHGYAEKVRAEMSGIKALRDLHYGQPLEYPSLNVDIDRVRARQMGITVQQIAQSLQTTKWSSRFVSRNFWQDPKSGIGYQVQVEVPQFDGVITERSVHPGALVGPSGGQSAQLPMLRIEHDSRLRLVVAVPEVYAAGVERGARVSFSVPSYPGQTFSGTVARLSESVDVRTRTMPVEVDVWNPGFLLHAGMFPKSSGL